MTELLNPSEKAHKAHDQLLTLGSIGVRFAGVERVTQYPRGAENDAEHSFLLGLTATEMAANYHPELNVGLVAQFSLVHDLPEVYAGDTPTFDATPEVLARKEILEAEAITRLLAELPPHTAQLLKRYEEQIEPEARFVRFIDKLQPALVHASAPEANRDIFKNTYGFTTADEVNINRAKRTARLKEMFPEFDFIHIVRDLISLTSNERIFDNQ